jgi:hypothetical protein
MEAVCSSVGDLRMHKILVMTYPLNSVSHDVIEGSANARNVSVKMCYLLLKVVSDFQAHRTLKSTVCVV